MVKNLQVRMCVISEQRTQDENNRLVAIAGHLSALRLPLMVTLILHGAVFVRYASCTTGW